MPLRKRRTQPEQVIDWRQACRFSADPAAIGVEMTKHPKAKTRTALGDHAVVWASASSRGRSDWAPCAFTGDGEGLLRLFVDPDFLNLLCRVEPIQPISDEENRHLVLDHQGEEIGTISRIPSPEARRLKKANKMLGYGWRIEQPDCPPIEGHNLLATPKTAAGYAAKKLPLRALESTLNILAIESTDVETKASRLLRTRSLVWKANDSQVMLSRSAEFAELHADWLDRRLAFTAVLLEAHSSRRTT